MAMTTTTPTTPTTSPSAQMPTWEARFRAPVIFFPHWNRHAPDRIAYASTESGRWQVHSWDVGTGERRQITDDEVGVTDGVVSADGEGIVWLRDETGSEAGRMLISPFRGGGPEPLADELPMGWDEGVALGRTRSIVAMSHDHGFGVYVVDGDGRARQIHWSRESVRVAGGNGLSAGSWDQAGLSADEALACLEHAEEGDLLHQALRVIDAQTGATLAELLDPGLDLAAFAWSPIHGDDRLLIAHERRGERAPAIWNVRTGEVEDLATNLEGLVEPADWWPDASAVLLVQLVDGRHRVHRLDLGSGTVAQLPTDPGSIGGARIRPDGTVWYRLQDGERRARLLAVGSSVPILEAEGPSSPPGRPFESWEFVNPAGQRVHGFLVSPETPSPHPLLMLVHGGPTGIDLDRWAPDVQAYVDAGFLVAMVNYRGSVGFGQKWRDWLIGNIGWPEVEDILAGVDDLVSRGRVDAGRMVIAGWSWGGYLTLLMHGVHPERFVAGIAGVPVGDYAAGYEDLSPTLQAYDRALLGGTPADVPELMAERSPIVYVDRVTAPLLVLAGRNDSRCPLHQVLLYTDRLKERSHPHELYIYETGHSSFDDDERVRQRGLVLDFLARTVPGIERLPGAAERTAELHVERVGAPIGRSSPQSIVK